MTKHAMTSADRTKIIEALKNNPNAAAVARQFGFGETTILTLCKKEGIGLRHLEAGDLLIEESTAYASTRKIARIESGVRQKTFGSCDLIMEGETGDAKCLTPSTLAPPVAGLLFVGPLGSPSRGLQTLARHPHHLSAGRLRHRG